MVLNKNLNYVIRDVVHRHGKGVLYC